MSKLHASLLKAEQEYGSVHRDKGGRFGKYATLQSIHSAVKPALARQGLRLQETLDDGKLTVSVFNSDRESISASTHIGNVGDYASPGRGLTPSQAHGSAITYARRYLTLVLLGLCPDDDDDGERATPRQVEQPDPASHNGLTPQDIHWVCGKAGINDTADLSKFLKASGYTAWAAYDKPREVLVNDYLRAQGRETIDDLPY